MRVRYEMADYTGFPTWQAECDLTKKQAKSLYDKLNGNPICVWAELVSEDDDTYMDVLDDFYHDDARALYKANQEINKVLKELFG